MGGVDQPSSFVFDVILGTIKLEFFFENSTAFRVCRPINEQNHPQTFSLEVCHSYLKTPPKSQKKIWATHELLMIFLGLSYDFFDMYISYIWVGQLFQALTAQQISELKVAGTTESRWFFFVKVIFPGG